MSMWRTIRITSASIVFVTAIYLVLGFQYSMWHPYWALYLIPGFTWVVLDLVYKVTGNSLFYRGLLPFIGVVYILLGAFTNYWIEGIIILSFIPFLVLMYNARFYGYKYFIIPIVFSILIIVYLYIGLFMDTWHPTWLIFVIGAITPLMIKY